MGGVFYPVVIVITFVLVSSGFVMAMGDIQFRQSLS